MTIGEAATAVTALSSLISPNTYISPTRQSHFDITRHRHSENAHRTVSRRCSKHSHLSATTLHPLVEDRTTIPDHTCMCLRLDGQFLPRVSTQRPEEKSAIFPHRQNHTIPANRSCRQRCHRPAGTREQLPQSNGAIGAIPHCDGGILHRISLAMKLPPIRYNRRSEQRVGISVIKQGVKVLRRMAVKQELCFAKQKSLAETTFIQRVPANIAHSRQHVQRDQILQVPSIHRHHRIFLSSGILLQFFFRTVFRICCFHSSRQVDVMCIRNLHRLFYRNSLQSKS